MVLACATQLKGQITVRQRNLERIRANMVYNICLDGVKTYNAPRFAHVRQEKSQCVS